jgi:hypothetical protein
LPIYGALASVPPRPSYETIVGIVADWAGLPPDEVWTARDADATRARHVAVHLALTLRGNGVRGEGLRTTAQAFGYKAISQAAYAATKVRGMLESDPTFASDVDGLKNRVLAVARDASLSPLPLTARRTQQPVVSLPDVDRRAAVQPPLTHRRRLDFNALLRCCAAEFGAPTSEVIENPDARAIISHLARKMTGGYALHVSKYFDVHRNTVVKDDEYLVMMMRRDPALTARVERVENATQRALANPGLLPPEMPPSQRFGLDRAIDIAAEFYGFAAHELLDERIRNAQKTAGRQLAMYLAQQRSGLKNHDIASAFGRDASAVSIAAANVRARAAGDPRFANSLDRMLGNEIQQPLEEVQSLASEAPAVQRETVLPAPAEMRPVAHDPVALTLQRLRITAPVTIDGKEAPLWRHASGPQSPAVSTLCRELFLLERVSEADAARLGVDRERKLVLSRFREDVAYKKTLRDLRRAVDENYNQVMSKVGNAFQAEVALKSRGRDRQPIMALG